MFAARRGGGATLNGAAIRASAIADLKTAGVEVGWNMRSGADAFLGLLGRVVRVRRGGDAQRLGRARRSLMSPPAGATAIVENHINAWDCLAGIALTREAGGYVSDFLAGDGLRSGAPIVACAPGLKDALIARRRD